MKMPRERVSLQRSRRIVAATEVEVLIRYANNLILSHLHEFCNAHPYQQAAPALQA